MDRSEIINTLVTNCDCWNGAHGTLNAFTDEQLEGVARNAAIADAAVTGFEHNGAQYRFNVQAGGFVANACAPKGQTAAPPGGPAAPTPPAPGGAAPPKPGAPAAPAEEEAAPPAAAAPAAPGQPPVPPKKKPPMANQHHDQSAADWLASVNAPPAVVNVVTNAIAIVGAEKQRLIDRLTVNCADDTQKQMMVNIYGRMSPDELRAIASTLPTHNRLNVPSVQPIPNALQPLYVGNAGGFDGGVYSGDSYTQNGIDDADGLDPYPDSDE